jgi:hypothetical protein
MRLKLIIHRNATGADVGEMLAKLEEGLSVDTIRDVLGIWLYIVSDHEYESLPLNTGGGPTIPLEQLRRRYLTLRTIREAPQASQVSTGITTRMINPGKQVDPLPESVVNYALNVIADEEVKNGELVDMVIRAARPHGTWVEPIAEFFEIVPSNSRWAELQIWAPALNYRDRVTLNLDRELSKLMMRLTGRAAYAVVQYQDAGQTLTAWVPIWL